MEYKPRTKKWFLNRIGKRVFRDDSHCGVYNNNPCKQCKDVADNGIVIDGEVHAIYMHDIDVAFGHDGVFLNYRDKK